jgi:CubicO group peptidase (beta-lactamase class C family)
MATIKAAVQLIARAALVTGAITVQAVSLGKSTDRYEVSTNKLDRFLADYVVDDFSGTLLIAQNGTILHAQGYGLANREQNIPNRLDTVFETGSLAKYFTATAILKLVEQNKLSLDDPLSEFFNNVPEGKQDITIHHLLTNTSGLVSDNAPDAIIQIDLFGDDDDDSFDILAQVDLDTFLEDVFSKKSSIDSAFFLPTYNFKPGDRFFDFTEGYNLLALVVEQRSGQSFEAFLNDQFFKPAGIKNTGYQLPDWKPNQLADGYVGEGGENRGNLVDHLVGKDDLPLYLQGSMGLMSTVEDIYAWHQKLYAGEVLRKDLVELLNTRHIGISETCEADVDYGYGIYLTETWVGTGWITNPSSSTASRNIPGFTTKYHYLPDDDIVVIYGSNSEVGREFSNTINRLIRVLLEPEYQSAPINADTQQ